MIEFPPCKVAARFEAALGFFALALALLRAVPASAVGVSVNGQIRINTNSQTRQACGLSVATNSGWQRLSNQFEDDSGLSLFMALPLARSIIRLVQERPRPLTHSALRLIFRPDSVM